MTSAQPTSADTTTGTGVLGFHGVRYLVTDVARAIDFYTSYLGFTLVHKQLPAFAAVSLGPLTLNLSGPGASGSRPLPGGHNQESGGSNRITLKVRDLEGVIAELRHAGLRFRNDVEVGPGGKQVQLLDPDDNPIELFEPAR